MLSVLLKKKKRTQITSKIYLWIMPWLWRTEFSSLGGPLGFRPQHQMSDDVRSARNTQHNADCLSLTARSDARIRKANKPTRFLLILLLSWRIRCALRGTFPKQEGTGGTALSPYTYPVKRTVFRVRSIPKAGLYSQRRLVRSVKASFSLLTDLLTPRRRVLQKPTDSQLVKKCPSFYGTRRFITAFTSARHLSLSWERSIQAMYPHPTSWRPF
jgi:hypothetical protein